jgi:Flp pilus assembly protein TadG
MSVAARFRRSQSGTTAVEFAITAPLYLMVAVGILQLSLYLWTMLGLKHAVDMSARCASIGAATCSDATATQNYAVTQAYGLSVEPTRFVVAKESCGQSVSVSYDYTVEIPMLSPMKLPVDARSCVPAY